MIENGTGGGKTITGLKFEERVNLREVIASLPDYKIVNNDIYFKGKKIACIYQKHSLYKYLLEPKNVEYKKLISKKLLPDDSVLVFKSNTLYIIEIKFQKVQGSVDEKLQTCDFKNKQYLKLLAPLKINVKYVYVLNDWFRKNEYTDVLNYITSVGCYYFFNVIPLSFLNLDSE